MRVFLDANILVSVVNHEYPLFTYSSRVVSLAGSDRFRIYTSPLCLAIAFYFAEKKTSAKVAKDKIGALARHITIAGTTEQAVMNAISDSKIEDFSFPIYQIKCRKLYFFSEIHDE